MPSPEELYEQYRQKTTMELYEVYAEASGYTEEARAVLVRVIEERGGLDSFHKRVYQFQRNKEQTNQVYSAAKKLIKLGHDFETAKSKLPPNQIPEEHIDRILNRAFNEAEQLREEMHMPKKTFAKGILGAAISAVLSGVLVAGYFLQTNFFSFYMILGMWFFSYGFIWLFTKKSKKNDYVILLSIFSTIAAILVAVFVFNVFGAAYLNWAH